MLPASPNARGKKTRATLAAAVVAAIATSFALGSPLSFATDSIFAKLGKSANVTNVNRGKGLGRAIRVRARRAHHPTRTAEPSRAGDRSLGRRIPPGHDGRAGGRR